MPKKLGEAFVYEEPKTGVCNQCQATQPIMARVVSRALKCHACGGSGVVVENRAWKPGGVEYRGR